VKKLLPLSSYALVLESVKKYDERFGVQLFVKLLTGSSDKRIIEWNLDISKFYKTLSEYSTQSVNAMIEALIYEEYLFRQS